MECLWLCGADATTDEDVFPNGLRQRFGAKQGQQGVWDLGPMVPDEFLAKIEATTFNNEALFPPGRYKHFKVVAKKSVCKAICNSGWMSDVQKANQDLIMELVRGPRPLSTDEGTNLATWCLMTGITLERAAGVFVDEARRIYLREYLQPPPEGIFVYLLRVDDDPLVHFNRSYQVSASGEVVVRIQSVTFDHLAMVVMQGTFTPEQTKRARIFSLQGDALRIWPPPSSAGYLSWPPPIALSRTDRYAFPYKILNGIRIRPG
jgi:hypothetical protein